MQTDPLNSLNGAAHDHYEALALRSLTEPLNYADRAALDDHLAMCEQCRASLDEWRAIRTAVKKAARKEAFSLPPLSVEKFDRKESILMILRPLPLAAAVAAVILTAFVIIAAQPQTQVAAPPQLVSTLMPAELGSGVATIVPLATPTMAALVDTISYVVREGDTLLAILLSPPFNYAADEIDSTLLNRIFELNPNIQGINNLPQPGIIIFIPARIGAPYGEWQDYTVHPGDTLASILLSAPYNFTLAQITPELVNEILRLNPDMDSSGALPDVGTTIRIPFPPNPAATSGDPLYMTATAVVQEAFGANGIDPLALTATAIIQEATATALNPAEIDPLALTATQIIQEATATAIGATVTATPIALNPAQSPRPVVIRRSQIASEQEVTIGDRIDLVSVVIMFDVEPTPEALPIARRVEVIAVDAESITLMLPPLAADTFDWLIDSDVPFIVNLFAVGAIPTSTPTPFPIAAGWVLRSIPLEDITTWGIPFQLNLVVNVSVSRHNPGGIGTDEYLLVPITQEAVITALDDTLLTLALPAAGDELLAQALRDGDSIYITATPTPDMTGSTPTSTAMP